MKFKTNPCLALIALLMATGAHAEILAWQSTSNIYITQQITVRESVTDIVSVTVKPVQTTNTMLDQKTAAERGSTFSWLEGIPSFPVTDLTPGSRWTETGIVTIDLSSFGHTVPVRVPVPVSYIFVGITEIGGRTLCHLEAEWYPLFIPSRAIAKRTGIERLSGASRMDLYWDNASGRPDKTTITEEMQYRFVENTALLFTRVTALELKESAR